MQPMLTVNEAMMVAADLKLGPSISVEEKQKSVSLTDFCSNHKFYTALQSK